MARIRLTGLVVGVVVLSVVLLPASALADTYTSGLPADFTNPVWSFDAGSPPSLTALSCSATSCSDGSGDSISASGATITMKTGSAPGSAKAVTVVWTNPFATSVPVTVTNGMAAAGGVGCTPPLGSGGLSMSDKAGALSGASGTLPPGDEVYVTLTESVPLGCTSTGTIGITATVPPGGGGGGGGGGSATLALASLGTAPLHVASPTISGTTTASGAVAVLVYTGTSPTGTPVRRLSAAVSAGHFAAQVLPALNDGQYTAVATQAVGSSVANSPPITFTIKVNGPALTLTQPRRHAKVHRKQLRFSGAAGTVIGDAPSVTISLYRGKSFFGRLVGKVTVPAHGSSWSAAWPKRLSRGFYTAVAAQHDDAGHTTHTSPRTFKLI